MTFVPDSTCNQNVLDAMDNRAWAESKREFEVAQSVIAKPDSVLQYSCFQQRIAEANGGVFVISATNNYLSGQFDQNRAAGGKLNLSMNSQCDYMFNVWEYSKCRNIDESLFNPLSDFISNDPRRFPEQCNKSSRSGAWQDALDAAQPDANTMMELVTNFVPPALEIFDPLKCSDHQPIDTGLTIFDVVEAQNVGANGGLQRAFQRIERPDRFCPAPGCYYEYDPFDLDGPGECKEEPN